MANEGYKKLHSRRDKIIKYLAAQQSSSELAEKLSRDRLITCRIYDIARNTAPGVVEFDRITEIFNAVLSSVELNSEVYGKFIRILKEIQGLEDIITIIDGKFSKYFITCYSYLLK